MGRPTTIAEVARRRVETPDQPLWKPLGEFLDSFYEAQNGKAAMLANEPCAPISRNEAAYLAAATEYLSDVYGLRCPRWVLKSCYFLDVAYWPDARGRAMETLFLAESPTPFRRRFIFTEGRPLRRKGGPTFAATKPPSQ